MEKDMLEFYKNALLGNATGKPLCEEYKQEWRACGDDKDQLMKFALRQQCLPYIFTLSHQGKGLTKDYLKNDFKDYINGAQTIYDADCVQGYTYQLNVDLKRDWTITTDVSAFMYCEDRIVTIPQCKCPTIYVGCTSDIHLALDGFNSVRVHLYDDSRLVVEDADEESNVIVYRYSDDAMVECGKYCLCDVREFKKDLRLQL